MKLQSDRQKRLADLDRENTLHDQLQANFDALDNLMGQQADLSSQLDDLMSQIQDAASQLDKSSVPALAPELAGVNIARWLARSDLPSADLGRLAAALGAAYTI